MLEIEQSRVRYGRHQALYERLRAAGAGEICVILGANGAGKSTFLKAIAGTGADRARRLDPDRRERDRRHCPPMPGSSGASRWCPRAAASSAN